MTEQELMRAVEEDTMAEWERGWETVRCQDCGLRIDLCDCEGEVLW